MPVIEAQCASILVPHDHRHINHVRTVTSRALVHEHTAWLTGRWSYALDCSATGFDNRVLTPIYAARRASGTFVVTTRKDRSALTIRYGAHERFQPDQPV